MCSTIKVTGCQLNHDWGMWSQQQHKKKRPCTIIFNSEYTLQSAYWVTSNASTSRDQIHNHTYWKNIDWLHKPANAVTVLNDFFLNKETDPTSDPNLQSSSPFRCPYQQFYQTFPCISVLMKKKSFQIFQCLLLGSRRQQLNQRAFIAPRSTTLQKMALRPLQIWKEKKSVRLL